MATINTLHAREVLDSRGNPTVEVEVSLTSGVAASAMVPSGASTGTFEALELRDGDKNRYLGKGVQKAVTNVATKIAPAVQGKDPVDQQSLDQLLLELDGSSDKSGLGANAMLGVSLAVAKAAAQKKGVPLFGHIGELFGIARPSLLPLPLMNILNGGAHADNNLDIQEFMIAPAGFSDFKEALRAGVEIFHHLKNILKDQGHTTAIGDEGGYAPNLKSNDEAFALIGEAIKQAGYELGKHIYLACDAAANEFFESGSYAIDQKRLTSAEMVGYYSELCERYPLFSLEDGLQEEDWQGWQELNAKLGQRLQLVGDDLFVTNTTRLKRGMETKAANAILIKVNQIGTLTETLETIRLAKQGGFTTVISHRSGETEDTFIADLAVGTESGQIKTGSLCRTDRVAKYNQLLRIAETLGDRATFAGNAVVARFR